MTTPRADRVASWSPESLVLGCDYNPEQWSEEVWQQDVALMQQAGVTLVAINIFGWAEIEPRAGEYNFTRLDAIMDLLHSAGIRVNLGTGTSSPPAWLTTAHPDILPTAADGTRRWQGGRQGWCPSSPEFRTAALGLVAKVAERYSDHPALAMWHVSNELGCHNAHCYCDTSAAAFRVWLQSRYDTIDGLNAAWGTTFWSQHYSDWNEVLPPRATLSSANPAQRLDFNRFSSDELLGYYKAEATLLRSQSSIPVTTNFMVTAHIRSQNYWQWASEMDVIANDHYLDHRLPHPNNELSFAADLTRGLAQGEPWMLMEQASSAVSWQPYNLAKQPGEMLRNTLTHVARGADTVCFFQWRASRQGAEKFHSALLPHAGTDTAVWRETLDLGEKLHSLETLAGTRVEASVALVFSWESWWAAEGDSQPSSAVRYLEQVHAAYNAASANGVTVDIVAPGAALDAYKLVIVPSLYLVDDASAAVISDYVAGGGNAVVTFFSGIVDETDGIRLDATGETPPGAFSDMLGVWTEQFMPVKPETRLMLNDGGNASIWAEHVRPTTADVVAEFASGPIPGGPAITRNRFGSGAAWYVATALDEPSFADLMGRALNEAGIEAIELPEGVEVVTRSNDTDRFRFVINHSAHEITFPADGAELLTETTVTGSVAVPAGGVRVIRLTVEEGATR
ncbi:beta-galactosidase [Salinibacterium sp. SWN139]|uniref:beta-galactosidase n=1 Tax=Salinibacterium sp. SWN139 TaxID=2792055 RepID=UPI0018CDBDB1|nr:beta-galactosidase [Salinibacterium sp. SWN139]MBH0053156.1 beta-galactosidase [Salinibacterium sp. SWN139]